MKPGIISMRQQRHEQIYKHSFTKAHDRNVGVNRGLAEVALYLVAKHLNLPDYNQYWPVKWGRTWKNKYDSKTDEKLLSDAGSLLAAEIDRIQGDNPLAPSGMDMIINERLEQIMKHGFTILHDKSSGQNAKLADSAFYLLANYLELKDRDTLWPSTWSMEWKNKFDSKDKVMTLVVAGALLGAKIDLLRRTRFTN